MFKNVRKGKGLKGQERNLRTNDGKELYSLKFGVF